MWSETILPYYFPYLACSHSVLIRPSIQKHALKNNKLGYLACLDEQMQDPFLHVFKKISEQDIHLKTEVDISLVIRS